MISDGKIIHESLKSLQTDRAAVIKKLGKKKLDVGDVFLMTLDRGGNFTVIEKEDTHI